MANPALATETLDQDVRFARMVARDTCRRFGSNDPGDAEGAALEALLEARRRYKAERGVPFASFARHRIRGAVIDQMRANDVVPVSVRRTREKIDHARRTLRDRLDRDPTRSEVAAAMSLSPTDYDALTHRSELKVVVSFDAPVAEDLALRDVVADDHEPAADAALAAEDLRAALRKAVDELPERERAAVVLFYFRGVTLKEIGTVLGVSESRACQLCSQAVRRLRAVLAA